MLFEKYLNRKDCNIHTSIKPFINSRKFEDIRDSVLKNMRRRNTDSLFPSIVRPPSRSRNSISPSSIMNAGFGYERSAKLILEKGVALEGNIQDKFSFNGTFIAGNSSFPSYLDTFITATDIVPGMGAAYSSKRGYSYQYYSGYLSYSPNKIFNFQIGKGKHFWGDGYRSLFLSDVSNAYPFMKISATVWKLKYVSLFTWMKDVTNPSHLKKDFLNKYGSFHYLSWNATKRINIALFESIIWQGTDSNRVRSFDVNYLNPVIFFRPVEYSLGSSDNAFLGASFKIKVGARQRHQFYGQLILDAFLL